MMRCPVCGGETGVRDTREQKGPQNAVRRTRQCKECGQRFFSMETLSLARLRVRKRNNKTEAFNEDKLRAVLTKIIEDKNPHKKDLIEAALAEIRARLSRAGSREVDSGRLADTVLDALQELFRTGAAPGDARFAEMAALRFAAAYYSLQQGERRPLPAEAASPADARQLALFES